MATFCIKTEQMRSIVQCAMNIRSNRAGQSNRCPALARAAKLYLANVNVALSEREKIHTSVVLILQYHCTSSSSCQYTVSVSVLSALPKRYRFPSSVSR